MSRTRYVHRPGHPRANDMGMVRVDELGAEEVPAEPGRVAVVSDLYMDGARATDGTDIGSRAKRREYMRLNGLADAGDFKQYWRDAEARRQNPSVGRESMGDTIARVWNQLEKQRRK